MMTVKMHAISILFVVVVVVDIDIDTCKEDDGRRDVTSCRSPLLLAAVLVVVVDARGEVVVLVNRRIDGGDDIVVVDRIAAILYTLSLVADMQEVLDQPTIMRTVGSPEERRGKGLFCLDRK